MKVNFSVKEIKGVLHEIEDKFGGLISKNPTIARFQFKLFRSLSKEEIEDFVGERAIRRKR